MSDFKMICSVCGETFESPRAKKKCSKCWHPVGERYGLLKTVSFSQKQGKNQKVWWALCKCDCGMEKEINWNNVMSGKVKSCGCLMDYEKFAKNRRESALKKKSSIVEYFSNSPYATLKMGADHFRCSREYIRQVLHREGVSAIERKRYKHDSVQEMRDELLKLRAIVYGGSGERS